MLALTNYAALASLLIVTTLGMAQDQQAASGDRGIWIEGGELIVVVPKSRTTIAAYSFRKSKWDRIELPEPLPADQHVVVAKSIAAFRTSDSIYAFTAGGAIWSKQEVSAAESVVPVLSSHLVKVTDGDKLFVMGDNASKWSGTSLTDGKALIK